MPKVTVTIAYDSLEEAFEDLMPNPPMFTIEPRLAKPLGEFERPEPVAAAVGPEKKARKPRADAGQPRGPYKKTAAEAPAESAAPSPAPSSAKEATAPTAAADPAPDVQPTKELTLADVRAAMEVLNKKGGIEANMKQLAAFGVQKASELPKEKYADFIAAVRKAAGV